VCSQRGLDGAGNGRYTQLHTHHDLSSVQRRMDTKRAIFLYLLAACSLRANGYGFSIDSSPTQCGELSISITGSGGKPPYRRGIFPWGRSPLENGQLEVRKILDVPFNDSSHVSFTLPYPKDSQFVAVVSPPNDAMSVLYISRPTGERQRCNRRQLRIRRHHRPRQCHRKPIGRLSPQERSLPCLSLFYRSP
jgi:hypothetical protein